MPHALSDQLTGTVVQQGDDGWDAARQAFNLLLDLTPAAIVLAADERDVILAVDYAREHGLRVAPWATGHNAGPLADDLDDVLIVNVAGLDEVAIDPSARRVRVGAGVKWEKVTPRLSKLGLAALHGSSPDVGVAGYSLGGGVGWLARKYGMQTNSVTAFEVVTADGRFVRTDATHHPDLFWALRGGNGNYGVVTAIEFEVYPHAELYAGAMFFPLEQAAEVLHAWRELLPNAPDELMTWANLFRFPDIPDVPAEVRGQSFTVIMGAYLGDEPEGRELLRAIRELGPLMDTFAMVPPVELSELAMDPPDPIPGLIGHTIVGELTESAVDDLLAVAGPGADTPTVLVQLRHMGGALARKAPGAGARASIDGEVMIMALGMCDPASVPLLVAGIDRIIDAVRPDEVAQYPNFVEHQANTRSFFDDETWTRLQAVKAAYDPADLFRGNHHIAPAAAGAEERRAA